MNDLIECSRRLGDATGSITACFIGMPVEHPVMGVMAALTQRAGSLTDAEFGRIMDRIAEMNDDVRNHTEAFRKSMETALDSIFLYVDYLSGLSMTDVNKCIDGLISESKGCTGE